MENDLKRIVLVSNRLFSSIRSKFIAIFFILGVMPLVVVGYYSYKTASDALLLQTTEQLGNLADKTAQQIDTFFEVVQKDINLLSNFPFIQLSFLQFEFGQRLDTSRRLLEEYEVKNQYCKRIHLIDLQGRTVLTVPGDTKEPLEVSHGDGWLDTVMENDLFLSDVILDKPSSDPCLILTKKVYDYEDKSKPVGILA